MTYVPSTGTDPRVLVVDAAPFSGPVAARWFNPVSGRFVQVAGSPLTNRGLHKFRTPGDNGTQANDWVLVLEVQ